MYEKYKAMRDTAIDIGKWINSGYQKGKEEGLAATKYGTPFMEQRLNRNQITGTSNNNNSGGGRNASYGRNGLYNKSSPVAGAPLGTESPESQQQQQVLQSAASGYSYMNIGSAGSDGLPNLKGPTKKE